MFRHEEFEVLYDVRRWRVVSSSCGVEAPPAGDASYRRWRLRHTHAHPHRELMLALTGDVPYGHNTGAVNCVPGTLLHFDAMEAHDNGYPDTVVGARHLWVGIGGRHAMANVIEPHAGRLATSGPPIALTSAELGFDPGAALARLPALGARDPRLARLELLSVAQALVARVIEASWLSVDDGTSQARAVDLVRRHVADTAGAGITLDGLSRLAGYSKFHLVRLFRARTGMGLREWIDRCRFERLQRMQRARMPLAKAAAELGFSSASALSRWCGRHGLTWRQTGAAPVARDSAM